MCGIVAVLAERNRRPAPDLGWVLAQIDAAVAAVESGHCRLADADAGLADLASAAEALESADRALRGTPGLGCLLAEPGLSVVDRVEAATTIVGSSLASAENDLDTAAVVPVPQQQEAINAALLRLKDAHWAISRDRLGAARAVADLAPAEASTAGQLGAAALDGLWAIGVALASLDRLEVRGRDSAGIHVLITGHGMDLSAPELQAQLGARGADPLFTSLAVRRAEGAALSLVYKAAAEIGELGDNVRALRAAVRSDPLLRQALASPDARCTVLGHTRWASVGAISQPNAHPVNSDETACREGRFDPYVVAALNGDVDNHAELRLSEALSIAEEVTTDAKVIPALISRAMADGRPMNEAFVAAVSRMEGSVAIAASAGSTPDEVHLALRGSGQSLYVGLVEGAFVVASEPYGLVEETACYVRMDGESTGGQIMVLRRQAAGELEAMTLARYDGGEVVLGDGDVTTASITTRDIDRGGFPHFLLKEISEAPASLRKTLRGRIVPGNGGRLTVRLGPDTLPASVAEALATGVITRVLVIGQGTAAVAGQSAAAAIAGQLEKLTVLALPATELSGFGLTDDMSDTLVVAVSQSGTTTDTNRTVDLVRARGAKVIAVVNRRNSDLATKAHGVLYTSDGRDIEMSVASTKAFYAQVAAGWLLAVALAQATGHGDASAGDRLLRSLRELPAAMEQVLESREEIGRVAAAWAPSRRYWAIVGSGPDRVAAAEVRIKLSELCYKAIADDATEDKKHIDLSSEPLILVCAAGLSGPNADDVAKEVAIYRAHKAAPIVIATVGQAARFASALAVVEVPACDPELGFVLSAMVGHLFGYEAALSIDAQAQPLREARAAIEAETSGVPSPRGPDDVNLLERLAPVLSGVTRPFVQGVRAGAYNGHMEAATAVSLVSLLRYATGVLPVDVYELESGKVGAPRVVLADLMEALSTGIDELTRPVDAIKHQAKTVTVGISRSEDALLRSRLVKETLAAGATADALGYRALRTLTALDPAVEEVVGFTRYRIDWAPPGGGVPTASVVDQGGLSRELKSRVPSDPRLRGTKHRAADEREVTVARGRGDGRTVVLVPEVKDNVVVGMTLLHVKFVDRMPPAALRDVLVGYRDRYAALSDAVTETEPTFDDSGLADFDVIDVLTQPVYILADRWRRRPA
ncbi:MAG: SIS domain-containing protein [Actinomycetota bacterium]|nr:SIS domain-containing protein [Actinomycetota bacterium]